MTDFTISHSHAEGTLAHGGAKGDGSAAVFKANGFRWFRSLRCWGIPSSRDRTARRDRIDAAQAGLQALGFTVAVEVDNTPRDYDTVREDRAQRLTDRAEALTAKADRQEADANAHFTAADRISSGIPFGQPILVGHHSERGHRRDLERIERNMDQGVAAYRASQETARRAEAAGTNEARRHSSPRAVAERIERTEAELRRIQRNLDGYADRWHDKHPPADGQWRDNLLAEQARLTIQVEGDRALLTSLLADLKAAGKPGLYTRDDVHKGDLIRYFRGWHEVVRVNPKSVSVKTEYSWTDTVPYTRIRGLVCPHEDREA